MSTNKGLNDKITKAIIRCIPPDIKPASYLMDVLNVGIDSAYRRLKGEIPYSFEEIAKISIELGFSIDEMVGESNDDNVFFEFMGKTLDKPEDSILKMLEYYEHFIHSHRNAQHSEVTVTMNNLQFTHTLAHEHLFKFFCYKWIHQVSETSINFSYSDMVISPAIETLREKAAYSHLYINNQVYIIDPNMILNTLKGIQYYYKRQLITKEEFLLIKKDLYDYIEYIEKVAQTGVNSVGSKAEIYISTLNIETNSAYSNFDGNTESHFWFYSIIPFMSNDRPINTTHRRWLDSIKRYAILITKSNEMLQAEVFHKTRKEIEETLQI